MRMRHEGEGGGRKDNGGDMTVNNKSWMGGDGFDEPVRWGRIDPGWLSVVPRIGDLIILKLSSSGEGVSNAADLIVSTE